MTNEDEQQKSLAAKLPSDTAPGIHPLNRYWAERRQRLEAINQRASRDGVSVALSGSATDDAGTIDEIGELTKAERDQLAEDLMHWQTVDGGRGHVTDGTPCWCEPTTVDPNAEFTFEIQARDLDPDFSDGIMVDGTRVGEQRAEDATSGADPCDTSEFRDLVSAAGSLHFAYHDHQAMIPSALARLREAFRRLEAEELGDKLGSALVALETEEQRTANLREQIETAIEELRFSVRSFRDDPDDLRDRDVVEAESLLSELGRIFGDRPEQPPEPVAEPEPPTPQIIDLMEALRASLKAAPSGRLHGRPLDDDGAIQFEHGSAADRRERDSARNERSDGHVEGIDR